MFSSSGIKRKEPPTDARSEGDVMKIKPLGAGNEVGRSCILLQYKGKNVLLDAGIHPAYSGLAALPFYDEIDPADIDVLLVSHFHLDHAASLPYLMEKTTFKGRVFMTHPTKAIYKWMLSDFVKVSHVGSSEDQLYDEQDLIKSHEKIEAIDYHQEVEIEGIKFTAYNAGHVLGAAMFLIEIAGVRVLYTGDYSREEDRHLMAAEKPPNVNPEVLICESTYGVQSHWPRIEREAMFTRLVHDIVQRGGRCLIPAFALGRAQELLLILDEYWQAHPELHAVPIYYASSLARKCMAIYQTYIHMMNTRIRKQFAVSNPFVFKHISNLKSMEQFDDVGPCVMMASPGMLQNGLSRELLELWCTDKRNGLIVPGYVVEGTLAKSILSEPDEIPTMSGGKLPRRLTVHYISFSAHVDFTQNSEFIHDVGAPHLVLVHGDSNEMNRLASAMRSRFQERDEAVTVYTPRNCEDVDLYFRGEKMAKTIGSLAAAAPKPGTVVSGILVQRDFQYRIMAPEDLPEFTSLSTVTIRQRQRVPCRAPFNLVKWHLEQMWGELEYVEVEESDEDGIKVFGTVTVSQPGSGVVMLEWEGNSVNDMIADSILAVVMQAESSPASVKATKSAHSHHHHHDEKDVYQNETKDKKEKVAKVKLEADDEPIAVIKIEKPLYVKSESVSPAPEVQTKLDAEMLDLATQFLIRQYGDDAVEVQPDSDADGNLLSVTWIIIVDDVSATVTWSKDGALHVECGSAELSKRLSTIMARVKRTLSSITDTWQPS
ncbi:hypothetical protein SeMB42_g04306 [Synchytrium endobioticum]|uniref:Endoribonuclease YSH1 n=1 Tax=Synchytrium endobioticum TaxID=286115 RepID=A0A507CZD3_9FUNG|nr:hypothetical protein SeMB42_g04306 [Synchytrium endobioticum]TPX45348.1 hypothetical protein SeLEV6574_g03914 [Synchytrium endobioticum]